ncbi:excisionase family DNA-binding protein [Acidovorax sp. IB03]|jgi:excisionase family DNA binding protein|nr:excisionase family DNA-binding protein [Acidovorax sp. IB03]
MNSDDAYEVNYVSCGGHMELIEQAAQALRRNLVEADDLVEVSFALPRKQAEKILALLEAESATGAVVVPVKEQFTTTEAARLLGISRPTLMKLIETGEIHSEKVATHHRIPAQALRKFEQTRLERRVRAIEAMDAFAAGVRTEFQNNVSFGGQK